MRVAQIKTVVEPKDCLGDIAGHRTFSYHLRGKAREQLFKHISSPREKAMRMSSLRNAFARLVRQRQCIAINKSYFIVIINQCATSQEATHACADDDRMPAEMRHFPDPAPTYVRSSKKSLLLILSGFLTLHKVCKLATGANNQVGLCNCRRRNGNTTWATELASSANGQ
jgi:hypothetical protein